jgi:UDP-N-acetylmuramyl pentapeptide phosphotransferase/UDP-N-acetylglucosamine-1-phosphate transferase
MVVLDRTQKVGLAFFIAAWAVLATAKALSYWESITFIFLALLLLSAVTFASDLFSKKMKLRMRGRIITAIIVVGLLLFFLAPAVQTIPRDQSSGSYCDSSGCSEVFQYESMTASLWCWGAYYSYSPLPALDLSFGISMGCPPIP